MLNQLKDIAAKQVGRVLASDATLKVISSPQVQQAVVAAINLRAEARDLVEKRVRDIAGALELVTRDDVAKLRRSIRDMEDHLSEMRDQLDQAQAELAEAKAHTAEVEARLAVDGDGPQVAAAEQPKARARKTKGASSKEG